MTPHWKTPAPLQPGDPVHIIAPSGAFDHTLFKQGCAVLESHGYVPVIPEDIFASYRYFAGDTDTRMKACLRALKDPYCKVVWAARGGSGAAQLYPSLAQALSHHKTLPWLVGFSDVSTLHSLWHQHRTASVHGANITTLATWEPASVHNMLQTLQEPSGPHVLSGRTWTAGKQVEGRLAGGNLTVLASLCGTGALPVFQEPTLLFLEDIQEKPYRIERCLTQLEQNGFFNHVVGVVLGQFTQCEDTSQTWDLMSVLCAVLARWNIPVLGDVRVGHDPASEHLLFGAKHTLDPVKAVLTRNISA